MHNQTKQQPQLPYQPIKFVYTETIGQSKSISDRKQDAYAWSYQDILQPKPSKHNHFIYYYLFHVAPIYNWLRKLHFPILKNYLTNTVTTQPNRYEQHKNVPKVFNLANFQKDFAHYVAQWEIVKLCSNVKIKVLSAMQINSPINSNRQSSKPNLNLNQDKTIEQKCNHFTQKEMFTLKYKLQKSANEKATLQVPSIYCEQCQKGVRIKCEITQHPFAPIFYKFYGSSFKIINQGIAQTYRLIIVYSAEAIYIKNGGGIWYQVKFEKSSIASFDKIQTKKSLLFVYQKQVNSSKLLKKAQPIQQNDEEKKRNQQKFEQSQSEDQQQLCNIPQKQLNIKHVNNKNKESVKLQEFKKEQAASDGKIEVEGQEAEQKLEQMCKNPLPIVLNKKNTDRKLFKTYKKAVQNELPKMKQKDDYQKEYDKGKTKKIHKNRQQFRTANFFQLYKKISKDNTNNANNKANQQPSKDSNHHNNRQDSRNRQDRGNRGDRFNRHDSNSKHNNFGKNSFQNKGKHSHPHKNNNPNFKKPKQFTKK